MPKRKFCKFGNVVCADVLDKSDPNPKMVIVDDDDDDGVLIEVGVRFSPLLPVLLETVEDLDDSRRVDDVLFFVRGLLLVGGVMILVVLIIHG